MQLDASLGLADAGDGLPGGDDGERRAGAPGLRAVEVAIDAAGRGGDRTFTYLVPPGLADLVPGEAVLVEFGRRQALGVILAESTLPPAVTVKPIADRIRADGPLLPLLTLALARWIAGHYLAPPALVLRAMLPPGLLERLDLVAELAPGPAGRGPTPGVADPAEADLLVQLERGPRPVRDLAGPDGRAGLLRRLRAMAATGRVSLEWTLSGAGSGPRYERWIGLSAAGRDASTSLAHGETITGRRLGPRQIAALRELAAAPAG